MVCYGIFWSGQLSIVLTPCKRPLDAWSDLYETTHIVTYNRYAGKTIPYQNIDVSGTFLERNLLWFYSPKRTLRPVSNVVLLPCRTQFIEFGTAVVRRLKSFSSAT